MVKTSSWQLSENTQDVYAEMHASTLLTLAGPGEGGDGNLLFFFGNNYATK